MKGLYGHRNINDELLKNWILQWKPKDYIEFARNYYHVKVEDDLSEHLIEQVNNIKEVTLRIASLNENYLFDELIKYMNELLFYCYFRFDSATAYCGNYYEVLVGFADEQTKKHILKGYDNIEAGGITLEKDGEIIGHIGSMSDLFWHTFYDQYIVEVNGTIEHIRNNEKDITLQIWGTNLFESTEQFYCFVEKVLFECSVNLALNFKRTSFESESQLEGNAIQKTLSLSQIEIEETPLRYFNFANYTKIPRHKYLAYYQVLEFFFTRAVKEAKFDKPKELLIVSYIINVTFEDIDITNWFTRRLDRGKHFTQVNLNSPALIPVNNTSIRELVAKRIYNIRCSLVHAKEAPRDVNFIPNLNDEIIKKEIPLIKFIAERVLYKWSKIYEVQ